MSGAKDAGLWFDKLTMNGKQIQQEWIAVYPEIVKVLIQEFQ
jgi:hypothetical protein